MLGMSVVPAFGALLTTAAPHYHGTLDSGNLTITSGPLGIYTPDSIQTVLVIRNFFQTPL